MKTHRKILGAAATALFPLLLASASFAQDADPGMAARVGYISGNVSLLTPDSQNWSEVPSNYPIVSGDRLYTDQNARAILQSGSTDVRMWNSTDVTLTNLTDNYEQIGIAQGSIRVRIFSLYPGSTVEVDTPNGAVIMQRPGDYRVNVYGDQGSLVQVNAGSVQITGQGVNQEVDQGQAVQLYGTNPIEIGLVEMPGYDSLDRWSIDRDHHILNSVSSRYVSRDMPGYDDLDDYGSWSNSPDYGPVWYPSQVNSGWQPYTTGHWAYVQPWGYTWVDDSPWGYAPFHYGRWNNFGGRWGWCPGPPAVRPIYSPALVAFVGGGGPGISIGIHIGGGGGGLAAWFPLGVGEPYVPWYHASPTYVRQVNVTNINTTVIRNTTIINNYNTFINNTRTVNNVNQINVRNVNYVNRNNVVAVNSNTMTSGGRVQQSVVRLNDQQRQQLVRAPIVAAQAPAPAPSRPLLQARSNVARPVARPVLMTTNGRQPATPAANKPVFRPAALPAPQPATAIKPAIKPIAPTLRPAAPANNAARPGAPAAPIVRPTAPAANSNARPAVQQPNQPGQANRPGTVAQPARPETVNPNQRPQVQQPVNNRPAAPANNARPVTPAQPNRPVEQAQPAAPNQRPQTAQPSAPPANNTRPAAPAQPARPVTPPANTARPAPPQNNVQRPPANQQVRPAPQQPTRPQVQERPAPQPQARPEQPQERPQPVRPTPQPQTRPEQQARPEPQRPQPQQQRVAPQQQNRPVPEKQQPPKQEERPKPDDHPQR